MVGQAMLETITILNQMPDGTFLLYKHCRIATDPSGTGCSSAEFPQVGARAKNALAVAEDNWTSLFSETTKRV